MSPRPAPPYGRSRPAARHRTARPPRDPRPRHGHAGRTRYAFEAHPEDDDFIQPGTLYREVMTHTDRDHLVDNIVAHLGQGWNGSSRNGRSAITGRKQTPTSEGVSPKASSVGDTKPGSG
ncbi:catalase-related domain-containing protein [Streptomyces chiangmaiensis]